MSPATKTRLPSRVEYGKNGFPTQKYMLETQQHALDGEQIEVRVRPPGGIVEYLQFDSEGFSWSPHDGVSFDWQSRDYRVKIDE